MDETDAVQGLESGWAGHSVADMFSDLNNLKNSDSRTFRCRYNGVAPE